ncbi:MAG: TonB family protein [Fluviicola sp.]|nr:TonB family protein [Fluviicola sp.]
MIAKKNSRFDLERKRTALFHIGLLTVGSLTLAAFTYKTPLDLELEKTRVSSHMIDIVTMEEPPEKPEVKDTPVVEQQQQDEVVDLLTQKDVPPSDDIVKVDNSGKEIESGITGELGIPEGPGGDDGIVKIDPDIIEEWPPIPTEYIGGYTAMQEFIADNFRYPQIDREFDIEGKVYLSFIIEKDGSVSNIKIERGVSKTIDREAKRVVRLFPKWKPAENIRGKVRTRVRLPINCELGG